MTGPRDGFWAQKEANPIFFHGDSGWGFGMAVYTKRDDLPAVPGRFGWTGGLGTSVTRTRGRISAAS